MYLISKGDGSLRLYRLAVVLTWLLGLVSGELLIYDGNSNSKSGLDGGLSQQPFRKPVSEPIAPMVASDFFKRHKRSQFIADVKDNDLKEGNLSTHKHRIRRAPCFGMYGGGGGGGGGTGGGGNAAGPGTGNGLNGGGGGSISTGVGDADFGTGSGIAARRRGMARRMSRRASTRRTKRRKFTSDNNGNDVPAWERRKRQTEQLNNLMSERNSAVETLTNYYHRFGERMQSAWKTFMDKMSDLTSSMTDRFN